MPMKKILVATILGASALVSRADFQDMDAVGVNINKHGDSVEGDFNLVTSDLDAGPNSDGFLPGSTVLSALAEFHFNANGNHLFNFSVTLDGIPFASGSVTGPNNNFLLNGDGAIDGSDANETAILAALADGKLHYVITRDADDEKGTLAVDWANLVVTASNVIPPEGNPNDLPDGGATAMLLGGGITALALIRRKVS